MGFPGAGAPVTDDGGALGLESGRVVVTPYDPRWPSLFEEAARELRRSAGPAILDVHHVGSTAVPGLAAKPVLDILVTVPDLQKALDLVAPIEALGYTFRPHEEIPDRHYFNRRRGNASTHHLSLAEPGSRHAGQTLAFRDALLRSPERASRYPSLKRDLARRFPRDRDAYIRGKSEFIRAALVEARHVSPQPPQEP